MLRDSINFATIIHLQIITTVFSSVQVDPSCPQNQSKNQPLLIHQLKVESGLIRFKKSEFQALGFHGNNHFRHCVVTVIQTYM